MAVAVYPFCQPMHAQRVQVYYGYPRLARRILNEMQKVGVSTPSDEHARALSCAAGRQAADSARPRPRRPASFRDSIQAHNPRVTLSRVSSRSPLPLLPCRPLRGPFCSLSRQTVHNLGNRSVLRADKGRRTGQNSKLAVRPWVELKRHASQRADDGVPLSAGLSDAAVGGGGTPPCPWRLRHSALPAATCPGQVRLLLGLPGPGLQSCPACLPKLFPCNGRSNLTSGLANALQWRR